MLFIFYSIDTDTQEISSVQNWIQNGKSGSSPCHSDTHMHFLFFPSASSLSLLYHLPIPPCFTAAEVSFVGARQRWPGLAQTGSRWTEGKGGGGADKGLGLLYGMSRRV